MCTQVSGSFSIHWVTCGPTGTAKDPDQVLGRLWGESWQNLHPPAPLGHGRRMIPQGESFFFLRSVVLHWFGGSRRMSHMRWAVLNDFAIPFPFKLPLLSLSDTCLNQCLPLQVMGWMYWGAHRPPLKSTKINTIIEIFSSWLHWGPRLGWLLWVCSSVARGVNHLALFDFCYWYESASPTIKCLTVKHLGDREERQNKTVDVNLSNSISKLFLSWGLGRKSACLFVFVPAEMTKRRAQADWRRAEQAWLKCQGITHQSEPWSHHQPLLALCPAPKLTLIE